MLAAVNSPHVPALAKVVAQMCEDCQKECEKFPDVAECKACGDSCKACAEECRRCRRRAFDCRCARMNPALGPDQATAVSRPRSRLMADASRHPLRPMGSAGAGLRLCQSMPSHGTARTWHVWCWARRGERRALTNLQSAYIGDQIVEFGIGGHMTRVHLLGVHLPHELDRLAQRCGAAIMEVWAVDATARNEGTLNLPPVPMSSRLGLSRLGRTWQVPHPASPMKSSNPCLTALVATGSGVPSSFSCQFVGYRSDRTYAASAPSVSLGGSAPDDSPNALLECRSRAAPSVDRALASAPQGRRAASVRIAIGNDLHHYTSAQHLNLPEPKDDAWIKRRVLGVIPSLLQDQPHAIHRNGAPVGCITRRGFAFVVCPASLDQSHGNGVRLFHHNV
jgi:hypothetical protein